MTIAKVIILPVLRDIVSDINQSIVALFVIGDHEVSFVAVGQELGCMSIIMYGKT
jgi:hypothetical protein